MRISQRHAAVIGAVEAWGEQHGQLQKLSLWPGLNLEQRAIGFTIILMSEPSVTVEQAASRLGMTPEQLRQALKGMNGSFSLYGPRSDGPDNLVIVPSNALAYGDAE